MATSGKNYFGILIVLFFAFFNTVFFYNSFDVFANDMLLQTEDPGSNETPKYVKVLITKKDGKTFVTTPDNHSFPVLKDTILIDQDGNKIQLSELPTPYETKIRYRLGK